jgi:cyclic-di-GMP-binding protein
MFRFGKSPKDPLADAKTAERWLASFPASDPLAVHSALLVELGALTERDARRAPARLEAVFHLDVQTEALRKSLTAQYLEHGNRSTRVESQLWQALFDLTQGFLLCYQAFEREISQYPQNNKWQQLLPQLIARQIIHQGLDARIRLYRYEQWIPARWVDLHAHFQTACTAQIERQPVAVLAGGVLTTIEQEYLRVLLLQLMNAGNLSPRHVEWVADQLSEWCAPLRLNIESSTVTSFYVDLGSRTGLKRRGPQPLEGRVLFLDTRPLHAVLMQNVVMLEQKVRNDPLSERAPRRAEQLNLLTKLASQVDPEFRPVARRGERTNASGSVDAIVGFAKITGFLRDDEVGAFVDRGARPGSFGDTLEIATFGRLRNESARTLEVVRRRLATYAAPGGAWEIRDVSQTGYRLVAPMTIISSMTLGTLTAIRGQGDTLWMLGIVRRMKRLTAERAEIGLQMIANNLVGVELAEQKRGDADYSVDGEIPTVSRRRFYGLFLSLKKRESESAVQTLIVPAGEYQPGKRLQMSVAKTSNSIAFGRLLEQQPDWIWATAESLDYTHRDEHVSLAPGSP